MLANVTAFTDTGLLDGTQYYYRLRIFQSGRVFNLFQRTIGRYDFKQPDISYRNNGVFISNKPYLG